MKLTQDQFTSLLDYIAIAVVAHGDNADLEAVCARREAEEALRGLLCETSEEAEVRQACETLFADDATGGAPRPVQLVSATGDTRAADMTRTNYPHKNIVRKPFP